jgi:hypothetical protein
MKMMIEAIGRDVMGVCLDSGNPVWMLEDPHMTLEMLILTPRPATCATAPCGKCRKGLRFAG